ncbi:histone-lysine N-methyltransferase 2C isoform X2 [Electrophorus electricus]|uniref:histone-lysine N-methyltransferase 2C isoform X2 n=1 Tax=Electrophorus electricus TaxID=8005 RepID=UPI0015D0238A|nr:histone-lysine N-methyltransferase 2C isoform X2 [Electrophorus electricus]
MSSEEKILDPSDKGPSPPLSSSVATPTGSPAPIDKRPRGRPRKDALSAAAQPPLLPRQRKKSRCRGKAVLEDEDSTDGMELAEAGSTQEPGTKAQQEDSDGTTAVVLSGEEEERPSSLVSPTPAMGVAETSAASGEAKSSERLCAFCYCGARSLLGQGELRLFKATPGCEAPPCRQGRTEEDGSTAAVQLGRPRGPESSGAEESCSRSWDELHHVGIPDDVDVRCLFDESGQCWAHQRCALWSEGVYQAEDQSLLNVDRAIHSGSTVHCAYCKRLGASIKCCEEGCDRSYHYPCAGGAGTFQDFRKLSVLCTEHIGLALSKFTEEADCVLCDSSGDLLDQLFCTSCGLHYHGMCLDISVTPLKRAGWQCPECKVCQTCKNPGEDSKMLVCDMCDKGYHTFCLQPVMDSIPTNGWRCQNCRACVQCGVRSSTQWHHNGLLCEVCGGHPDTPLPCPLCSSNLDPELHKDLLSCLHCKRWFHLECERQVEGHAEVQAGEDYVCSACKHLGFEPGGPVRTDAEELLPAKVGSHIDAEGEAHPDAEPQPARILDDEEDTNKTVSVLGDFAERRGSVAFADTSGAEAQCAEASHKGPMGEKVPATQPPQDLKPASSPEPSQQEQVPAAETPVVSFFMPSAKAEPTQETPMLTSPAKTAFHPEDVEPRLEEQNAITPSTKELTSVSEPSEEEPMEVSLPGLPELSLESEASPAKSVPKVETEEEERVGPVVVQPQGVPDGLSIEQHEGASESLIGEHQGRATEGLTVEQHKRTAEGLTVEQHTGTAEGLTVEQHKGTAEDLTVEQHKRTAESLTVEQRNRTTETSMAEQHDRATEDVTVDQHERATDDLAMEEHERSSEGLTDYMDVSLDGERSLAKLSSLVEERTSLKPSPVRQPESLPSSGHPSVSPQSHSGMGEASSNVPSATFIPFMPKIGMGKPAISKRKFSPGRPRVKQGRGSGFPGRRRPRGAGLTGRGGRGRSRMKNGVSPMPNPGINAIETTVYPFREEEENAMHNTVVIFSSTDTFTLKQDMCVVCGSFGQGVEGRLLACAQCGQCYHPYCVNIKITKVVLSKGWRCLECTVCEACGQASDPGRLLLCDDCDISYHTYCLDPPLQNVPNGSWKCKWCVSCTQCGATSPGVRCEWQNNYTQCAPCASLACCPVCLLDYSEEEIILQCHQCDRWMHALCQGFHSEEEVEKMADSSFDCSLCQGSSSLSPALGSGPKPDADMSELPVMPQIPPKSRDLDLMRTYTQDGVCLTESGLSQLQSLASTASRRRRPKPKLKLRIINQNSVAVLQTPPDPHIELSRDGDLDDTRAEGEIVDGEGKSDSSPEREPPVDDESKGSEACKKRKRKPYRPGIGGFMVRQRNRTGPGKAKPTLGRKDSTGSVSETPQGKDEGWGDLMPDTPVDEKPPMSDFPENSEVKVRKRYRKKKTKLEEAFPTYLQEAFFGKDLLDKSKQSRQETTGLLEEERDRKPSGCSLLKPPGNPTLGTTSTSLPSKAAGPRSSEEPLVDLSEVLKSDTELLGMLSDDMVKQTEESGLDFCTFQVDCSPSPFAGLEVAPLAEEAALSSQSLPVRAPPQVAEEPLDGILSPELDKMVTDESILSKLYKIPELEGKDVEDLFTAVLSPSTIQASQVPHQSQGSHPLHGPPGHALPPSQLNSGMFPRMPVMNGLMAPNQQFPPSQMPNVARNFATMQRAPFSDNLRDRKFSQMSQDAAGPWAATGPGPAPTPAPPSAAEGEGDSLSTAQKSTLKWEKEETLGELATVAPVLYTNVNFPNLKEEYPDWQTRVKQIAKLWRKASSQDRAPYVQKARDNRAALRINKVQMSNETIKRQQQPQSSQPLEVFDSAIPPLDPELLFKDPLKHKESEQEQEWKLRQQMRQKSKQQAKIEATQKLEQVKNEQLQQQQQQQHNLKGGQSEHDNSSSLLSPGSSQSTNGNMSPMQPNSKNGLSKTQLPGTPTSGSPDDVFLRPHPPAPSSGSQPQSPQMFSPGSSGSRPSSPWDPYAKMVGTPRPPTSGPGATRRNSESGKSPRSLSEERGKPPSVHEPIGSPTSVNADPYAKPPDTPRPAGPTDPFLKPMCPPRASQSMEGRHLIGSPGHDPFSRPGLRKETYSRMPQGRMILSDPYTRPLLTPIPGSNESGSVQLFKTPMPPPQPQESNAGIHSRRPGGDPFERPMIPPRSAETFSQSQPNDPYVHPPLTPHPGMSDGYENQTRITRQPQAHPFSQPGPMAHQPAGNPYARSQSNSRADYSPCDPFSQSPYSNPYARMPGTPRPHDPEPYSHQSTTSHPVIINQTSPQTQTQNRILSPMSMDPYAQPPGASHPNVPERFIKSQSYQRSQDPFNHPSGLSRPIGPDPHAQPVGSSQSILSDPYAQPPRTPRPGGANQSIRPGHMSNQDSFSPPQVLMQDTFTGSAMPGSQTPRHPGMVDENNMTQSPSSQPSQTPVHDAFEQAPLNPHPQCGESREQHSAVAMGQPNTDVQSVPLAEAEERLRQRQRIRELILRQQQQKSAIRQEKTTLDQPVTMTPGTGQHWSQETQGQQSDVFNRPPPPYPGPGTVRSPQRFHGPFPADQRGCFPDGQFPRPQFPMDNNNIRQPGPRLGFPPGVQGPGLRPHQMQESMMEAHPQMRRSLSIDLGKTLGGNPMGLQPMPPRSMHVQQHNIMGQPFIELRHRPADSRLRLSFGPPVMQGNRMESPSQAQRPPGFISGQEMGFPSNQAPKPGDPTMNQTQGVAPEMHGSVSMENLNQPNLAVKPGHPQIPLMRSMSQPASNESFSGPSPSNFPVASATQNSEVALPSNEGDADESAVKDLEDVEVKDLVDTDLENLNLDPDDGKDLDLETNDLHLEEIFLTSGKFDIIAYTDADLDLSEDLDLNDPIDDHTETSDIPKAQTEKKTDASHSTSGETKTDRKPEHSPTHLKNEVSQIQGSLKAEEDIKIEAKNGMSQEPSCKKQTKEITAIDREAYGSSIDAISQVPKAGIHPDATPVLSSLLVSVPTDSETQKQESCGQTTSQSKLREPGLQPTLSSTLLGPGAISVQGMNPTLVVEPSLVSSHSEGPLDIPGSIQDQPSDPMLGVDQKEVLLSVEQTGILPQTQQEMSQQNRPLLLEEQPLLLQDLLDQERQEQQQQKQMQAMIRQRSSDSFFPNIDFDAITDPIMKAKMVALKGINKVMVQNNMGMSQMVINKFPVGAPAGHGPQVPDALVPSQQPVGQEGKLAPYMTRPSPPNFNPGFANDAQKVQYEDWLRETQKLLQMQQKFLEEQIGAHRKSKKALSAKQRTAKKAGREFPEEDAEQLKHVTEQQGVVQKQLEQIRKQQKEHAELIEEYRVKQQQGGMQPPMMPGRLPIQGHPGLMPTSPMNQPQMGPTVPMQLHPGQTNPLNMPGWRPGAPGPVGPQIAGVMSPQIMQGPPPQVTLARPGPGQASGESPHVSFDDTNPFSEGFQERERKERLREQQERQRVQLMKEVERQRMKQRMEMEQQQQQGLLNQDGNMRALSQMPFYNQNLPQDFMQPHRSQQQMQGPAFSQQPGMQGMQPGAAPSGPMMGNGPFLQDARSGFMSDDQLPHGPNFVQGQPRPPGFPGTSMVPQNPGQSHPFGVESSMPLPPNFPGSGPSLIQLYSNIIPDEKGKKKRSRKKKKDDDAESLRAPSTPHSDLTAPLTPCVSDTSSTPTRNQLLFGDQEMGETSQQGSSTPGSQTSQPHSELERQLSESSCGGGAEATAGQQDMQARILTNIKLERMDASDYHGPEVEMGLVKEEGEKEGLSPRPARQSPASIAKAEGSNELLKQLLKNKETPPPALPHQKSEDSLRSEDETCMDSKALQRQNSMDSGTFSHKQFSGHPDFTGPLLSEDKKKQRTKRTPKSGERPAPRSKKRKKEEDEKQAAFSSTEPLMTSLKQQPSLLPLMEPLVGVNFAHFVPYGSGQLDGESRLSGTFGSASLDGMSDYYSQLIYKQSNLSNPPTPPASLPPTPPPVARQKLLNGFATTDELASKVAVLGGHDVTKGIAPRPLHVPFKAEEELLARALAHGPKTVDVPASLPTPPHNNQEELRGQEHCEDRDTPDSFIPSSSPESVVGMEISRYPDLSLVKKEPPSPSLSPVMPIFPHSRGKGSAAKLCDIKTEPSSIFFGSPFGIPHNGSSTGLVSIAITLKPAAAENITDVVAAITNLIGVKIPSSYEVSSGPWPHGPPGAHKASVHGLEPRPQASGLLHGCPGAAATPLRGTERNGRGTGTQGPLQPQHHLISHHSHDKSPVRGREQCQQRPSSPGPKPQWCRHCKVVVLGNGVRKPAKDQQSRSQEMHLSSDGELVFCSHSCLILHSSPQSKGNVDTKASVALLADSTVKVSPSKAQHKYNNNMSSLDVHCLAQLQPKLAPPSPPPPNVISPGPTQPAEAPPKVEPEAEAHLRVTVKLKPRSQSLMADDRPWPHGKRWKGLRWRRWTVQVVVPKSGSAAPEEAVEELLQQLCSSLRPCPGARDRRRCCFCQQEGDGLTDGPARLLNLDLDTWVHLNCALWSSEVYETQAGALINVELARQRGQTVACAFCQRLGATSGCHRLRCLNVYHFTCALQAGCTFFKDKTMLCHQHRPRGAGAASAGPHLDQQLRCFSVFRRVYVQRDELRLLAAAVQRPELGHTFRVGSLLFHAMGQLPAALLPAFHSASAIFPPGYEASRLYWSMRHSQRRCRYICSVEEQQGRPEFTIRVVESGYEDLLLTDTTAKGVWDKVLISVAERRAKTGMLRLFPIYLKGEDLFGLTVPAVARIAESLPGIEACSRYRFRYGRNLMLELPLSINPSGSARSELRSYPQSERPKILSVWNKPSCVIQNSAVAEGGPTHSKHFVHSKSSQYRRLTSEWKSNVYLAHSRIQGLGLFAARDIEKQTMVIEYLGHVLRNEVALRKELQYKAKNRTAFMFRIDSDSVIDATCSGSPARYINHSCSPNCVAEVVTFERGYKIIISSSRRIEKGEELCYNYKLGPVDSQNKIPCLCGTANCRKWLN